MANIVSFDYPTSKTFKDLSGMRFGRLVVNSYYGKTERYEIYYKCTCDCGTETIICAKCLKSGDTVSCGCYLREVVPKKRTKHGLTSHPLYWTLNAMKFRCYNPKCKEFSSYGGRGIVVCDEWLNKENGFINFYNWSIENGYDEGLSIDRIDVDGPYCPANCRWADTKLQHANMRKNRYLGIKMDFGPIGKDPLIYTFTLQQWSEITKLSTSTILRRIQVYGWSVERALTSITDRNGRILGTFPLIIPPEILKYNQPEKFAQSIH